MSVEQTAPGTTPLVDNHQDLTRPVPDLDGRDLPRSKAVTPHLLHLAVAPCAADVLVGIGQDGSPLETWTTVVTDTETLRLDDETGPERLTLHAAVLVPEQVPAPAPVLSQVLETLLVGRGLDDRLHVDTTTGVVRRDERPLGRASTRRVVLSTGPAQLVTADADLTTLGTSPAPLVLVDTVLAGLLRGLGAPTTPHTTGAAS